MTNFGRTSDQRRMVPAHHSSGGALVDRSWALNEVEVHVWREADSAMIAWIHPKDPTPTDLPDGAVWFVERSSSPYGPWYSVAQDLDLVVRQVRDDSVNQSRTNSRHIFYRVRWESRDPETGDLLNERVYGHAPQWDGDVPGGVTWGGGGVPAHQAPAVNRELRARSILLLSSHTGEPCLIYRPSWLAPMDPNKVNPYTGTYTGDWGSDIQSPGQPFVGGYDHPFLTYVDGGSSSVSVQLSSGRVNDMNEGVRGEFPYWPPMQIDDIIRFYDGQLAQVSVMQPVEHLGHVNVYVCQMTEVERTHPINGLPMPEGFRQVALFPRRQAARSMNMESYRKDLERGGMRRASLMPIDDAPARGEDDR